MFDDQDGCDWVNITSGASRPGQSQTKGRQMVVCVCVCVMARGTGEWGCWSLIHKHAYSCTSAFNQSRTGTYHCLGMSVLCEYAITAFFAYFSKVHISHIFRINWHSSGPQQQTRHMLLHTYTHTYHLTALFPGLPG